MTYLSSENIRLRALESTDLAMLYEVENDEHLWVLSHTVQPYSKKVLTAYLEQAHQDIYSAKQLRLVIEQGDQSIGLIDLFEFDPFNKRAGVGIFVKSDYRHRGFGAEALALIKRYCFEFLGIHQLFAHIEIDNSRSLKLFEHQNFVKTGEKTDWLRVGNAYKNVYFLQCINDL